MKMLNQNKRHTDVDSVATRLSNIPIRRTSVDRVCGEIPSNAQTQRQKIFHDHF
jgi:hypothetical protein